MENKQLSKFLSLLLRHRPEVIGLQLDAEGWADLDELLLKLKADGKTVSLERIQKVVANNDKQRFKLDLPKNRIRANQGHSIPINLALPKEKPPQVLFHGTATRYLSAIMKEGLVKKNRQHVHLSADRKTAFKVGGRHGKPVILLIDAAQMDRDGQSFFLSENIGSIF